MGRPRLLTLAVAATLLALPSSASAADLVVKVANKHVTALRGLNTSSGHGSLRAAIRAWGHPSSRSTGSGSCHVNWATVGVKAVFSGRRCSETGSRIQRATLHSKHWTTQRGLHVGDPTAKVKQLYPGATFTVGYFWLYKRHDAFVGADAPFVTAQMKGGAVHLIQVFVASG
jgi:hypothetical protein